MSYLKRTKEVFSDEIKWISNKDLRNKTIEIWSQVWGNSDWKNVDLEDIPYNTFVSDYHLIRHVKSVVQVIKYTIDNTKENFNIVYDNDILISAAILHDVTKLFEMKPSNDGKAIKTEKGKKFPHGFMGAVEAIKNDLPIEIVHMIITHTVTTNFKPQSFEGMILWYIDAMESDILYGQAGYSLSLGTARKL